MQSNVAQSRSSVTLSCMCIAMCYRGVDHGWAGGPDP